MVCGIDWVDSHHDVMVIDETGQQAGSLRVAHTKAGIEELKRFLLRLPGRLSSWLAS